MQTKPKTIRKFRRRTRRICEWCRRHSLSIVMTSLLPDVECDLAMSFPRRQAGVELTSGAIPGWRGSGVLNMGERAVWSGGEKTACWERGKTEIECLLCVTNNNPSLTTDRSLLMLLSPGCNAYVQKTIWPIIAQYASPQRGLYPPLYTSNICNQWREKCLYTETIWSVNGITTECRKLATRKPPIVWSMTTHHSRLVPTCSPLDYTIRYTTNTTICHKSIAHINTACCRQLRLKRGIACATCTSFIDRLVHFFQYVKQEVMLLHWRNRKTSTGFLRKQIVLLRTPVPVWRIHKSTIQHQKNK